MHTHSHHGHGHHHHGPIAAVVNKAFIWGIVLNTAYVIVQATAGIILNSMALLSDAGHNLSDVISLVLGLFAHRLSQLKPTQSFTYGYKKTTILAALANAVFLLVTIGIIAYGSISRLFHPEPLAGGDVAIVATIGIIVNGVSALFFFRNKEHDMNVKGAYLHLLADALVSVGVVVAGLVIRYTHWYWLDSATSLVILVVILWSTWSLLTDSLRLSLDAVPMNIKSEEIVGIVGKMKGVKNIHHIHIWAMSTTENALTAHVVADESLTFDEKMKLVGNIKHELMHNNIHHATIELEAPGMPCDEDDC